MVQSLRDPFTVHMKKCKSKTRQVVIGTGLRGEELSEDEQLPEDLTERFEESERRTEANTQKRLFHIENEKKKAQEMRRKEWKDLERQEDKRTKMKMTLG